MPLRAGERTATLVAEGDEDVDLLKAWEQDPFRIYDFTGPMDTVVEVTTGDSVYSPNPPYAVVDTGHGANLIRCHGEEVSGGFNRPNWLGPGNQAFRHPLTVSAWMRVRNRQNTTATQFAGIGIGYPDVLLGGPPWPALFTAACVQLRLKASDLTWELVSSSADMQTVTVQTLTGIEAAAQGVGQIARLVWNPDQPSLRAYINGVLGSEITDAALLPDVNNQVSNKAANWFVTSGTHASGYISLDIGPVRIQSYGVQDEV